MCTIHSAPGNEGKEDLLQRFRTALQQPDFDSRLQTALRERFDEYLVGVAGPQPSALAPEKRDAIQDELLKPGRILCDCPSPRTGSTERFRLAMEPKRRLQNYANRAEIAERVSEVWEQVNYRLMAIASKGRVYCHPGRSRCSNVRDRPGRHSTFTRANPRTVEPGPEDRSLHNGSPWRDAGHQLGGCRRICTHHSASRLRCLC